MTPQETARAKVLYDDGEEMTPWILPDAPDHSAMLAILLAEGLVHLSMQDLTPHVLCSDTFGYACADSERIDTPNELVQVFMAYEADRSWGTTAWCIVKRRQRPIAEIVAMMQATGAWTDAVARASEPAPEPPAEAP
jgi:hypothetical protein